jgi:hypothetical protein
MFFLFFQLLKLQINTKCTQIWKLSTPSNSTNHELFFGDFYWFFHFFNSNLNFWDGCYRWVPLPYPAVAAVYHAVTDGKKNAVVFATGCTCTHWGWGSASTPSTLRTGGSLDRLAAAPTKWWIDNPQFQPPRRGGIGSQTIARTMFALDACEHNYYLYAYHTWLKINL